MRHSATQSLLSRDDVIVVSSVSCIYGIDSPEDYGEFAFGIAVGDIYERSEILSRLVFMQYERNDIEFDRGQFRVRGILHMFNYWNSYICISINNTG